VATCSRAVWRLPSAHAMTKSQLAIGISTCLGRCTECGVEIGRAPCNDKSAARHLLAKASAQVRPQPLVADAGYDAEWVHEFCRERWRVSSWIPLAVRSRNGQVQSHRWRAWSMTHVPRWQRLVGKAKRNHRRWRAWSMTHVSRWQCLVGMVKCEAAGVPRGGRCPKCTVRVARRNRC
jgi:hypothetical protein